MYLKPIWLETNHGSRAFGLYLQNQWPHVFDDASTELFVECRVGGDFFQEAERSLLEKFITRFDDGQQAKLWQLADSNTSLKSLLNLVTSDTFDTPKPPVKPLAKYSSQDPASFLEMWKQKESKKDAKEKKATIKDADQDGIVETIKNVNVLSYRNKQFLFIIFIIFIGKVSKFPIWSTRKRFKKKISKKKLQKKKTQHNTTIKEN